MRALVVYPAVMLLLLLAGADALVSPGKYKPLSDLIPGLETQFLIPHNAARASLRMRPLAWDKRLEAYAKSWAERRRQDCALQHSNGPYGENIFWGSGVGWAPSQAVAAWVEERQWYKYGSNSCDGGKICGHYTQVVWRETRKIGCASVTCDADRGVFITCNYDPPGNYVGERPY